jgi:tripartite-type tricarboxylate transporter receptor subunit TctC
MTLLTRRNMIFGIAGSAALAGNARAANYPDRTVRIIVPFAPGGPTDIMARIIAAHLNEKLRGSFIVENRAGAGGNIGTGVVARATPDGYTLLLTSSAFVVNPGLYKQIPYDPYKDFAPIAELGTSPNVFLATPGSGIKSISELIAKAKTDPTALSYASPGIGTTPHLSGELLKIDAGIKMTHVPYGGAGPAIQAILSATTPIACTSLPPARPLIAADTLVALAVTGRNRWFDLPDVPTMIELGYKDFVTDTVQGFLAPAKAPIDIVSTLASACVDILHEKAIADQLQTSGFEVLANGPAGMKKRIEAEVPKWRDLIAKAGIMPV